MTPYYDHAGITIYHGDCREIAPPADLIVTDPPFGIGFASNYVWKTTTAPWMRTTIAGDEDVSLRNALLSRCEEWACFGSPKVPPPPGLRNILIWDKGPAAGMGDLSWPWKQSWELIFMRGMRWSGRRDEGVLKGHSVVTRAAMGRTHPNEKPVSLLSYLIRKHPAPTVLDPFMGSGATLIAAKQCGRTAIGIEVDERYCEIAAERLGQEVFPFVATA